MKLTSALVLDIETTSLSREEGSIIEICAAYYSIKHRTVLNQVSTFVPCEGENAAEEINRISADSTRAVNDRLLRDSLNLIYKMAATSDILIAHNAEGFDRDWLTLGKFVPPSALWADSMFLNFPLRRTANESLINLALGHGFPVLEAHRAGCDVELLVKLLGTVEDLESVLIEASKPKALFYSLEPYPGLLSKKSGFKWNPGLPDSWNKEFPKKWLKTEFLHKADSLGFGVVQISEAR